MEKLRPFQEDYYSREKAFEVVQIINRYKGTLVFSDPLISQQFNEGCEILENLNKIPNIEVFAGVYAIGMLKIIMSLKNTALHTNGINY